MIIAARELYCAEGHEAVTVRNLACRMGLSPAALYRHFQSRDQLLDAVASNGSVAMSTYFNRHSHLEPRAKLTAITGDALDFALGNPKLFKLMFDDARKTGMVHGILIRGAAKLLGHEPLPDRIAHAWLALVIGAAAMHRIGMLDEPEVRKMCEQAAARLFATEA